MIANRKQDTLVFFHKENVRFILLVNANKESTHCMVNGCSNAVLRGLSLLCILLGLPLKNLRAIFAFELCELYTTFSVSYYFCMHFSGIHFCMLLLSLALFVLLLFSFYSYSVYVCIFYPLTYIYFCKTSQTVTGMCWILVLPV